MSGGGWEPGRWWRVLRDGKLWCETSSESEARASMAPGDVLERLYVLREEEWRPASVDVSTPNTDRDPSTDSDSPRS